MWNTVSQYIGQEWDVLISAPLAFGLILLGGIVLGLFFARLYYKRAANIADRQIALLETQLEQAGLEPKKPTQLPMEYSQADW